MAVISDYDPEEVRVCRETLVELYRSLEEVYLAEDKLSRCLKRRDC